MAKLDKHGNLLEFVAVEVQTIDTTGNYRNGYFELVNNRNVVKTTAGLNWENVSKRILPQLIYKGQVLQREKMCKKGLFLSVLTLSLNASQADLVAKMGSYAMHYNRQRLHF